MLTEYEARLASFTAQADEILADSRALGKAERDGLLLMQRLKRPESKQRQSVSQQVTDSAL